MRYSAVVFIALLVTLLGSFFVTADVAHAQGCGAPKRPTVRAKCALSHGAVWRFSTRSGKCMYVYPHRMEAAIDDCTARALRSR